MRKPLTIAGIAFPSERAAFEHCRRILRDGPPGSEIVGADAEFVEAILSARADKLIDLHGLNVIRYLRDWQDGPVKSTVCFWAELEDGSRIDFSFMKAVRLLAQQTKVTAPCP
jgi:hypothetical protein